ncbi:MAG: hypothetical protein VYC38_01835 [Pseudomonadota bacterium]|nr:hypothetical protein [Pseudomonadota bacterium]
MKYSVECLSCLSTAGFELRMILLSRHNSDKVESANRATKLVGIDKFSPTGSFNLEPDENIIRIVKLLARQKAEEDFARATGKSTS